MNEISAFGVIHKSLVSKKVWPVGTKHRYLWNAKKVAPQFGGTKAVKPGRTPPNPASKNSQKKAAAEAASGRKGTVKASGAVESRPDIQSVRQGARTGRVIASTKKAFGRDLSDSMKAKALKQGNNIGGDNLGTMRFAGENMAMIRHKARISPRGTGV